MAFGQTAGHSTSRPLCFGAQLGNSGNYSPDSAERWPSFEPIADANRRPTCFNQNGIRSHKPAN